MIKFKVATSSGNSINIHTLINLFRNFGKSSRIDIISSLRGYSYNIHFDFIESQVNEMDEMIEYNDERFYIIFTSNVVTSEVIISKIVTLQKEN